MSKRLKSLTVRLTFRGEAGGPERDDYHAYLYEKLDELMREASGFAHYRVLTGEDFAPTAAGEQSSSAPAIPSAHAPVPRYWAVTGRLHGDDEDTGIAFRLPMATKENALLAFVREIRSINGYPDDKLEMPNDINGNQDDNVYINSVFSSLLPIENAT